jgi:proteasome lid subunit RPN8/RPN11
MLNHRNGTKFEDLTFIDSLTGKHLTRDDYNVENEVMPSRRMRSMVTNSDPHTIIAVHNHPGSSVPSIADIESAYRHKYKYGVLACHNGTVMKYEVLGEYNEVIVGILLDNANKNIYNGSEEELSETIKLLRSENIILEVFK